MATEANWRPLQELLDPNFKGGTFIIWNDLAREIDARLDEALADAPEEARRDRPLLREQLLRFYHEHGYVPEVSIDSAPDGRRG